MQRRPRITMSGNPTVVPDSMARYPPESPVCMRAQVEETIEVIRPALQADGGDIVLRDVDEVTGIVSVTLVGACGTCPASTTTLKAGVERIMRDRFPSPTSSRLPALVIGVRSPGCSR
jgi:Fe-S cluster biogenesis protein NfuA